MRDRTRLSEAITRYRDYERDLSDYIELADLGEAEGDEPVVDE